MGDAVARMTSVENADEGRAWDWLDDADDIIVPDQPPVAVYVNPGAAVVVRQRAPWPDEDDPWIWFAPEHAPAVAAAILAAAGLEPAAVTPEPTPVTRKPKCKDPTAAERQRRRRQRKKGSPIEPDLLDRDDRDGATLDPVTPRDDRDGARDGDAA